MLFHDAVRDFEHKLADNLGYEFAMEKFAPRVVLLTKKTKYDKDC